VELSDAEAIARAVDDPREFVHVFDRHGSAVHSFLSRRAGHQAADELLAEVWLQALRSVHRYDARIPSARPWLYGIARNTLRAHWRSRSRDARAGTLDARLEDPWGDVDAQLDAARRAPTLQTALEALASLDRDVLLLVAWEELTPAEIAVVLGIPAGTVRWRLHRARMSLQRELGCVANETGFETTMGV
jgi:RNA polymerase sigma-70 factor (ECF subfamily)